MTISSELRAKILRYFHVEKWRIRTIANALGIHHATVKRVLAASGAAPATEVCQSPLLAPYLPFIFQTLKMHPTLPASRLYDMVCERGYRGGPDHFRHLIALHRPAKVPEAYLRLRTLPGEQGQVDWGHFGHVTIGRAKRPVMAFVMVLSYSRKIFCHFYLNAQQENFLRGHQSAFEAFGGIPRVLLYDNLKSVVLERQGDAIRFHPKFLAFSGHYHFEPRPVAVARGNEKGRVERSIRYIRTSFFAARKWRDIDDLNAQVQAWCEGRAADRPCPEDKQFLVREVFEQEQPTLLSLPPTPYPCDECESVNIAKTPYARFDGNDYSVPHRFVQSTVTVQASLTQVTILSDLAVIATHPRSFDKAQQIEKSEHLDALVAQKRKSREHRGQDRLTQATASGKLFLMQAAAKGYSLRTVRNSLILLLEEYGQAELELALQAALDREVPHPNAVRHTLEARREQRDLPPPVQIRPLDDARIRHMAVQTHALESYDSVDTLTEKGSDNNE